MESRPASCFGMKSKASTKAMAYQPIARPQLCFDCPVTGLGGKVYRSGDYDYYINETIRNNDPKAVGPFILASLEWERLQDVKVIVNRK